MSFGATSKVMAYAMKEIATKAINLSATDVLKFALFTNTVTPANTVTTAALASYKGASSTWVVTHEVATATGYTRGGKTVTRTLAQATTHVKLTATALSWTSASFTAYGGILMDTTFTATTPLVLCYNSFGGSAETVSSGTFTVTFSATGVIEFSC